MTHLKLNLKRNSCLYRTDVIDNNGLVVGRLSKLIYDIKKFSNTKSTVLEKLEGSLQMKIERASSAN